jgi:hypothetical protein
MHMVKTATGRKAPKEEAAASVTAVAFKPANKDKIQLRRRERDSKFKALKDALESAKIGDGFTITPDQENADQFRTTLYSYMRRFNILVSCKMTTDGQVYVEKKNIEDKREVAPRAKRKAS